MVSDKFKRLVNTDEILLHKILSIKLLYQFMHNFFLNLFQVPVAYATGFSVLLPAQFITHSILFSDY